MPKKILTLTQAGVNLLLATIMMAMERAVEMEMRMVTVDRKKAPSYEEAFLYFDNTRLPLVNE